MLFYDIPIRVFDSRPRDFERQVLESSKLLKSFIARHDISLAISAGTVALSFAPFYIAKFHKFIPLVRQILADRSDWRNLFTKAIADETMRNEVESEFRWMEATMETIQSKVKLLNDENPSLENRRTIASNMHTELDRMINFFNIKSSLFPKISTDRCRTSHPAGIVGCRFQSHCIHTDSVGSNESTNCM